MEGFRFSTELAVRFAETDAQGVAHNAAYLVWFEVARIEYLARFGGGYKGLQADGYEALTTESHVRYLQPIFFDDRVPLRGRPRVALPVRVRPRARRRERRRRLDAARGRRQGHVPSDSLPGVARRGDRRRRGVGRV
jgi:hypothetical protein